MTDLSESQLQTVCAALGWQGGTYWQAVEEIRRLVRIAQAAKALLPAMAECQEIARLWEPDDSSGKQRQWLVRGRDAARALREALGEQKP